MKWLQKKGHVLRARWLTPQEHLLAGAKEINGRVHRRTLETICLLGPYDWRP